MVISKQFVSQGLRFLNAVWENICESHQFVHTLKTRCIVCIVFGISLKRNWSYVRREQCVFVIRALLFSALVSRQHISGDKSTWSSVDPVNESSQLKCHCVIGPLCVCTCVCVTGEVWMWEVCSWNPTVSIDVYDEVDYKVRSNNNNNNNNKTPYQFTTILHVLLITVAL